jgi:hypothetical protein
MLLRRSRVIEFARKRHPPQWSNSPQSARRPGRSLRTRRRRAATTRGAAAGRPARVRWCRRWGSAGSGMRRRWGSPGSGKRRPTMPCCQVGARGLGSARFNDGRLRVAEGRRGRSFSAKRERDARRCESEDKGKSDTLDVIPTVERWVTLKEG